MGDETRTFTASDGYAFAVRVYPAPAAPVGRLVFLHGIRSHGGWYTRSCQQFAAAGYEAHFLDRRGAGLNPAARGDTPNFRRLLDDVAEYLTAIRTPGVPTTLAGISWGGKPALAVAARAPHLVDAVVLLCPGFVPLVGVPPLAKLRIALARLVNPTKPFPIPLNEPDLFTTSPEWQRFIADDPHGLTRATARFLFGSARLDLYLKRVAKRVTAPVLCLLAEHDRVIHNAKTLEYLKRAFPDRVRLLQPGMPHLAPGGGEVVAGSGATAAGEGSLPHLVEAIRPGEHPLTRTDRFAPQSDLSPAPQGRGGATRNTSLVTAGSMGVVDVTEYPGAHHTLEFDPAPSFVQDVTGWLRRTIPA